MGGHLSKPITTKETEQGNGNGLTWNCCAMQGWRIDMEDAHITKAVLHERLPTFSLFAVFDGHAGKEVAQLTSLEFTDHLLNTAPFNTLTPEQQYKEEQIKQGIKDAFRSWDAKLRTHPHLTKLNDKSGCTATGVLMTPKHYFVFNVGDSRCVLVRDRRLNFASDDHKPMNPIERKRIEHAGGQVIINRINGSLAVSRALGDFDYKATTELTDLEQLVSPDPDVTCIERDEKDNYFLVACDGIYDFLQNEEIVDYLNDRFAAEEHEKNIVSNLIDLALHRNSRDNMSAIVISFDQGKIAQEPTKVTQDKEVNESIRNFVKEYIERMRAQTAQDIVPIEGLWDALNKEDKIVNSCLPVFGLTMKRGLVERHYYEFINATPNSRG